MHISSRKSAKLYDLADNIMWNYMQAKRPHWSSKQQKLQRNNLSKSTTMSAPMCVLAVRKKAGKKVYLSNRHPVMELKSMFPVGKKKKEKISHKFFLIFNSKIWLTVTKWEYCSLENCTLSGLRYEHEGIRWTIALTNKKNTILRQNCGRALETPVPSTSPNPLAPSPQESARNLHNPNRLLKRMHLKWKDADVFLAGSLLKRFKLAWKTAEYLISVPHTLMCAKHIMGLIFLHRRTKSNQENHISKD